MAETTLQTNGYILPVLPLKNMVALPKGILPVRAARAMSVQAAKEASLSYKNKIFVVAQKSAEDSYPGENDLYKIGVEAKILQFSTGENGSIKVLLEGVRRAKVVQFEKAEGFISARVEAMDSIDVISESEKVAMVRSIKDIFQEFVSLKNGRVAKDLVKVVDGLNDLEALADSIAMHLDLNVEIRQEILEISDIKNRALRVCALMEGEIEILKAEKNIRQRVQSQVEKHQKDYYLNEQVRAIYRELGKEDNLQEIEKFRESGKKLKLSDEAYEKLEVECHRLEQMQATSPEAAVSRGFVEWLLAVPWFKKTKDKVGLANAEKILNSSHAGMDKAKDRILEFVAAKKFAKDQLKASPVICLVGPPGVGKTSLAKSISKALGREFVRISLGGMRDEAEIRGHRRTYIGALPGKIISAMRKSGVTNPVVLLDEVDKMAMDFRGDPSSALLEVLDPEQNNAFVDHFLEVGYDLSKVIFIATANVYENIPYPLLDRMEMISLSGYTEDEKVKIAQKFLIPDLLDKHAVNNGSVKFPEKIIRKSIADYTREAGVRQLGRVLSKLLRKSIQSLLSKKKTSVTISEKNVLDWLGHQKYKHQLCGNKNMVGVATGLAWTETGGEILEVEAIKLKGKNGLTITGQLGEVMQESAQAALSYIRSRAKDLGLKESFYSDSDLHIHLPEGAIPKDGPSAGVTMTVALASILTGIPIKKSVAMSGEVTLQGRVLAVGGLKEKVLAAIRFGSKHVLLPKENEGDVKEFEKELGDQIKITFVDHVDEVLRTAMTETPFKRKKVSATMTARSKAAAKRRAAKKA